MTHERKSSDLGGAATALMGVAAGAIGVWVLDRVDWFMWDRMNESDRARTRAARPGGEPPAHALATKLETATGLEPDTRAHDLTGDAIHYSIGIAPAVGYALLRDKLPLDGPVRGLAYGLGLFLVQDEAFNTVSGLGGRPGDYPWQDHARGLVAHLVYGLTTKVALNVMEAVAERGLPGEQPNSSTLLTTYE